MRAAPCGLAVLAAACAFDPSGVTGDRPDAPGVVEPADGALAPVDAPPDAPAPDAAPPDAAPPPDAPPPPDAAPLCPPMYELRAGGCYRAVADPAPRLAWTAAEAACAADGAHLVAIDDDAENAYVRGLIPGGRDVWIGANDRTNEGTWVWSAGGPLAYENWADGEPNDWWWSEDCGEMLADGAWNDASCGDLHEYVCERPPL